MQNELIFFDDDNAPSEEARRWMVDPTNPGSPFSKFIGNEQAVRRLAIAAYSALGKPNHVCSDQNFALLGPASAGKTMLTKLFSSLLGLPFLEVSPGSVADLKSLLHKISETLNAFGDGHLALVPEDKNITIPPMVVFIDEVHALKDSVIQGLLKATEKSDGVMDTGEWIVDCKNVCWIIATTDRGLLFDAFDTRFTRLDLELYTAEQVTQMVQIQNPDWNDQVCKLVALYGGRLPREVKAFAKEMRLAQEMSKADWISVAHQVARDQNIDEFGMTNKRLLVLKALSKGPVATKRLPAAVGVKIEELDKFILPALLSRTADQPPMITIQTKGYMLTDAGLAELEKRSIKHGGRMVTM